MSSPQKPIASPTASPSTLDTLEDNVLSGKFLASDASGTTLTFSIASPPGKGSVELLDATKGTFIYTPDHGQSGTDQFDFTVINGQQQSDTATIFVHIEALNELPVIESTCWSIRQSMPLAATLSATDAESPAALTYSMVQDGAKGSAELAADGSFTYTPHADGPRGGDSFTFQVQDPDGGVATGVARILIDQHIMPLGDSITEGTGARPDPPEPERVGYRRDLYQSLVDTHQYGVDFVGSLQNGEDAVPPLADVDHEGHQGWSARHLLQGRDGGGYPVDGVRAWLDANPPDIVLLHIGTNKFEETSVNDISKILDEIDLWESGNNPVTVFLARIIEHAPFTGAVSAFNDAVANMAQERTAAGDHIILVDQQNALAYPDDMADDDHPAVSGYGKMAAAWLEALLKADAADHWSPTGPLEKCP